MHDLLLSDMSTDRHEAGDAQQTHHNAGCSVYYRNDNAQITVQPVKWQGVCTGVGQRGVHWRYSVCTGVGQMCSCVCGGGGEGLGHNKGRAFVGREGQHSTSKAVQCTCWRSTRAKVVLAGLSPDAPSTTPIQLWLPEAWDWHEPSSPGKGLLCPAQSQLFAMHNV